MLLGLVVDIRVSETGYAICYRSLEEGEAEALFTTTAESSTADLSYPFTRLRSQGYAETVQPLHFWNPSPALVADLNRDEAFLRVEAVRILREQGFSAGVVYDPACSTGTFLSEIKEAFPESRVVGQDLNAGMIALARQQINEVYHADAASPVVPPQSADIVVCRHLNLDVVTTQDAERLFLIAARTVKPSGLMLVFGHTPVLLSSAWFEGLGFEVVRRVSTICGRLALFQFYVLRQTGTIHLPDLPIALVNKVNHSRNYGRHSEIKDF
ncbi:MAG: class I SAM-dependent methyltransferase [Fischerella sp. CENA71]|nr:class I SAM-dependent methyltransferase [Fischerella sp. CENA71]